jgi:hypothetical protein
MFKKISIFLFQNYPLLFVLDALLSLIDDISIYFLAENYIRGIRGGLATFVVFLGVYYFFNLFFIEAKSKAKYYLLPGFNLLASVFSMWNMLALIKNSSLFEVFALEVSPHTVVVNHPGYLVFQIIMSLVQLGLGIYVLGVFNKDEYRLKEEKVKFVLAPLVSMILLGVHILIPLFSVPLILISGTGGFLAMDGTNITSIERTYVKADKKLHLIPMVHIGDESFYKEISKVDGKVKTLFLLEGVSDQNELLKNLDYGKFAANAGLDLQKDHFNPEAPKEYKHNISVKMADIDVKEFNPETRDFLKKVFDQMNSKSFLEVMYMSSEKFTAKESAALIVDLVQKRNKKVLSELKKNENDFQEIYIPWGAAHMPEIERDILKDGYKPVSEKRRTVISLEKAMQKIGKNKKAETK